MSCSASGEGYSIDGLYVWASAPNPGGWIGAGRTCLAPGGRGPTSYLHVMRPPTATGLLVECRDEPGILYRLAETIFRHGANVAYVAGGAHREAAAEIQLEVSGAPDEASLVADLEAVEGVTAVTVVLAAEGYPESPLKGDKITGIAADIPLVEVNDESGDAQLLLVSWGSTYAAVAAGVKRVRARGMKAAHVHLRHFLQIEYRLPPVFKKLFFQFFQMLRLKVANQIDRRLSALRTFLDPHCHSSSNCGRIKARQPGRQKTFVEWTEVTAQEIPEDSGVLNLQET